ncbi:hypothetical protein [Streptomyces tsukubensis]|uniref:Uncharacterized protein n=1 Tax=Streptomyces tsukubensis TaxID=83656 RepID=A0A1V4AAS2_9ACTN|nr:hypothetical protein [Streptomyces tsukubensis]OON80535.1 hypothetical protein B1H18_11560 [Streptomyces tsukubensis]QFR96186.1 hypothetical protein GBW32_28030 [Streptomyces tsukubensis]
MSGSPKYSRVAISAVQRQREARRRHEQQVARRRREAERARERAERAAERAREAAARRERARAAADRRKDELAARRTVERQAHAARLDQEQGGADVRRLDEARELLARVRASDGGALADELDALERRLQSLRGRAGRTERLGGQIEELRGRVVLLSQRRGDRAPSNEPGAVLADLERRLAEIGPDAAEHDPEGRQRCVELLGRLRTTTGPDGRTRFEALLGTVEHALTRHAVTAGQHAEEKLRGEGEARRRAEERAAAQEAAEEAEQERLAAEAERQTAECERRAADLAEAADRLDVMHRPARDAAEEALELADPDLSGRIEEALRAVTVPLAAGAHDEALAAVAALEALLPEAEARLDELQLDHSRRMDLGQALQDAMHGEGFSFLGGEDHGGRLVLRFERPSGASYETTVTTGTEGTPVLVYHVDGEPDVALEPAPEGAVCDTTEDLLRRVHEVVGEEDAFVPGELDWQGKPPSRQAKQLPGAEEWRWTQ